MKVPQNGKWVYIAVTGAWMLAGISVAAHGATGDTRIAKWRNDKQAAFSIGFDDARRDHGVLGVPAFVSRGLVGTWFVPPKGGCFQEYESVWLDSCPAGNQELANHTMHHADFDTYDEAQYELSECSRIITAAYPHKSKLLMFAPAGGTTWESEFHLGTGRLLTPAQREELLRKNYLIQRGGTLGEKSGTSCKVLNEEFNKALVDKAILTGGWEFPYFHSLTCVTNGIEQDSCWKAFERFLDYAKSKTGQVWSGGAIAVYKYSLERDNATVSVKAASDGEIRISLKSTANFYGDAEAYDEPLTLITTMPESWKSCYVTAGSKKVGCKVSGNEVMYDAVPNRGDIVITPADAPVSLLMPEAQRGFDDAGKIVVCENAAIFASPRNGSVLSLHDAAGRRVWQHVCGGETRVPIPAALRGYYVLVLDERVSGNSSVIPFVALP